MNGPHCIGRVVLVAQTLTIDSFQFSIYLLFFSIGHDAIVEMLLRNGANVNAKGQHGWMPLHQAVGFSK